MWKKLLIIALMAMVIGGCSMSDIKPTDKDSLTTQMWGDSGKLTFSDADMTDDATTKMNTYIDVRNFVDPTLNDSINAYMKWAWDGKEIDSTATAPKDGSLVLMSGDEYISKAQTALKATPKIAFDDIANKYLTVFTKLLAKNNELYAYYHNGENTKDKWAKGKTLHTEFMALVDEYDNTYPSFIKNYDEWFLDLQLDNMRYYKQEWETAKYAVEWISLYKKYLMDEIDSIDKKINKWATTVDTTNLQKYFDKFTEAVDYINGQTDKAVITSDLWAANVDTFDSIKKVANELQSTAKTDLLPLLTNYDKTNLEKINTTIDKLYDLEDQLIKLRNKTIN